MKLFGKQHTSADYYSNIGKPEKDPRQLRIRSTAVPENKPLDVWMNGFWGRYSFHMAKYKLLVPHNA